jgi:hypothetical protein
MEGYGPNDAEVLRFLGRVAVLRPDEARTLVAAAETDPSFAEWSAWAVRRAALVSNRVEALEAAQAALRTHGPGFAVPWFGRSRRVYWDRFVKVRDVSSLTAARPVLIATIGALVVRDLLPAADVERILRPWAAATAAETEPAR